MRKSHRQIDLNKVKTYSIEQRKSKVKMKFLGKIYQPGEEFQGYIDSLPDILKAAELRRFAQIWAEAAAASRQVILMMGAHPIKVGLSPIIIDLIERGYITAVAGNGAVAVHDCELCLFGHTSEDVLTGLCDGTFGMARETADFINDATNYAFESGIGFGEALGIHIERADAYNRELSIINACRKKGIPCTIHVGIGTDIVHQQPSCKGEAVGASSFADFKILAEVITRLSGGLVMNLGSAVIMPEVFLKALTVARNVAGNISNFNTANFDMILHYRPLQNVLNRPTKTGGGEKFSFTGHHEIMFPLVAAMVKTYKIKS